MKPIVAWFVIAIASYAGLAGGYHAHLDANPRRVVVVVDSSNPMRGMLPRVDAVLDQLATRRYHEFALFTDRSRIHTWATRFSPGRISPYGPRERAGFEARLEALRAKAELAEADEIVLITNAQSDVTGGLGGWTIHRLE